VPIAHRVTQFIEAIHGDGSVRLTPETTAVVTLLLKRPLTAIAAGILAAAKFKQF